jgi:hypothetical protein
MSDREGVYEFWRSIQVRPYKSSGGPSALDGGKCSLITISGMKEPEDLFKSGGGGMNACLCHFTLTATSLS